MASRARRSKWQEAGDNVRRAQALAAKYDVDHVHPSEFMGLHPQPTDWDDLLKQMK